MCVCQVPPIYAEAVHSAPHIRVPIHEVSESLRLRARMREREK